MGVERERDGETVYCQLGFLSGYITISLYHMHACIYMYIIHTCIQTNIHTYTYMHAYINSHSMVLITFTSKFSI